MAKGKMPPEVLEKFKEQQEKRKKGSSDEEKDAKKSVFHCNITANHAENTCAEDADLQEANLKTDNKLSLKKQPSICLRTIVP